MMGDKIYRLTAPDSAGYYYLVNRTWSGWGTWWADDQQMEQVRSDGWYRADRAAEHAIIHVGPPRRRALRYDLIDQTALSVRFPAQISIEDWGALDEHEQELRDPLYKAVVEESPGKRTEYPVADIIDLSEGEPAPKDGLTWRAKLPYQLAHHIDLLHLFPGALEGFRPALADALNQLPGVTAYDQATFAVYAKVPYSPARTKWLGDVLATGRRSTKRGREVEDHATRHVDLWPPREIPGETRAAAKAEWDRQLALRVERVRAWAEPAECGHCQGSGLMPPPDPTTGKAVAS